ncbi:MAG: flagellar motor protein MotB [Mycobacteriales bacterium]
MSARRAKHHEEEEHENHERWLVTYADMLTVLMALFLVMYAMSVVDQTKAEQLAGSVREYFGTGPTLLDGGSGLLDTPSAPTAPEEQLAVNIQAAVAALDEKKARAKAVSNENEQLKEVQRRITESLTAKGLQNSVRFKIDERGLVVTIVTDEVLFTLGSATLLPAGRTVLDGIGPALVPIPNPVTVEGHTDNLPISGGRFPSNWELSTERATTVLRYIIASQKIPAKRMSAAGYADQRPLVKNTPQTRAVNRRVEVIVRATAADAGAPVAALPAAHSAPAPPRPAGAAAAAPAPPKEKH